MDALRAARRRGGGVPADRRDQRVHRRDGAVDAREGSGAGRSADAGAVRRGGSDPAGGGAARRRSCRRRAARSCAASGAAADGLNFDRDGRWRNDGERVLAQDGPLWPRSTKETTTVTDNESTAAGADLRDRQHLAPQHLARRTGTAAPSHLQRLPLAPAGRRSHLHRRLHEGRAARREGADGRARARSRRSCSS